MYSAISSITAAILKFIVTGIEQIPWRYLGIFGGIKESVFVNELTLGVQDFDTTFGNRTAVTKSLSLVGDLNIIN